MYDWSYVDNLPGCNVHHSHRSANGTSHSHGAVGIHEGFCNLPTRERYVRATDVVY